MKKRMKKLSIGIIVLVFSICLGSRTALAIHQETDIQENILQLESLAKQ